MSDYDIHSCGYYCDRHACILRQRNELRDKLFSNQAMRGEKEMKPYEEVCFPSGIIRWVRENNLYVCRLTEDQMNQIKEIHETPYTKTYSSGTSNYTQLDERMIKRVRDGIPDMPIKAKIEKEPMIDGWPLYSGLPPAKVQDERSFEEFAQGFAQSARVNGIPEAYTPAKGGLLPKREPSGSWTSWDNTMCNPLADARMQTQSAWKDGYDSAKAEGYAPSENNLAYERGYIDGQQKQIELAVHKAVKRVSERDWHELTDNEIAAIKAKYGFGVNIFSFTSAVRELETWLKERNNG